MQKENAKPFMVEKNNNRIYIVDYTCCDIEGEHFKYEFKDKYDAECICEKLNELHDCAVTLNEVLEIIHCIKYAKWSWEDLHDYFYKKDVSLHTLKCKYDDIYHMIYGKKNNGDD